MFSLNFLTTCLIVVLIPGTGVIFTVPTGADRRQARQRIRRAGQQRTGS